VKKVYIYYIPALNKLHESKHPQVISVNYVVKNAYDVLMFDPFRMYKTFLIGEL